MEEQDQLREFTGTMAKVRTSLAMLAVLVSMLYILGIFFRFTTAISLPCYTAIMFALLMTLCYLRYPATKNSPRNRLPWYDLILIIVGLVGPIYFIIFQETVTEHMNIVWASTPEIVFSIMTTVVVIEGARRSFGGLPLAILAAFFAYYPLFAQYLPGIMSGNPSTLEHWGAMSFLTYDGVFGRVMYIVATIAISFLIFGSVLSRVGGSSFFVDLSLSIFGWARGGPAKVALFGSALFGTISGSTAANVATTGVITIPLMKRTGYRPEFAGAVEAVASTGGQIMPPIMGFVAFVMADFLGISYTRVIAAALVPAILYFLAAYVMIDLEAVKRNLKGIPRAELPSFWKTLSQGWYYLIPIVVLIWLLMFLSYSPQKAGMWSVISLAVVSIGAYLFKRRKGEEEMESPLKAISGGLETGILNICGLAMAGAAISYILMAFTTTGLGFILSSSLIDVAGGNLTFLLVLTAVASFILGMASDALTCYIVLVILVAPALVKFGILPIAAHMFVFYWGLAAFITPPVALAVYVATTIAGSKLWPTAWNAVWLGIGAFLVPFIFISSTAILGYGTPMEIALQTMRCLLAIFALSLAIQRHFIGKLNWLQTIMTIVGAFLLAFSGGLLFTDITWYWALLGLVLIAVVSLWQWRQRHVAPAVDATSES